MNIVTTYSGLKTGSTFCRNLLSICHAHRRTHALVNSSQIASILSAEFKRDEEQKVLDLLNSCNETGLRALKHFSGLRAGNLVRYREEHGDFNSLSDLLAVPGFGVLGIKRIAKAIVNEEANVKKAIAGTINDVLNKPTGRSSICHPRISPETCQTVSSIVSLDVQQDAIFSVHMDRSLTVENWTKTQVFSSPTVKYDHVEFHQCIASAVDALPEADAYILENKIYRYQYLKIVPVIVALRLMEAITITMLNQEHYQQTGRHCVYNLKPHVVSNYFNLIVGGERVSCQHIARDIINRCSGPADGVTVPDHLADYFYGLNHADQESLARSLLLAVIFYKRIVLPAAKVLQ